MNLTFSMEAVLTKQVEMPACSPHHARFGCIFHLSCCIWARASALFLSLFCHSISFHQFNAHKRTLTLSFTNEPAVKLMFCNHLANCRYAISAPRAAHALDLSLGVHLKDLRESRIQWSKRGDR